MVIKRKSILQGMWEEWHWKCLYKIPLILLIVFPSTLIEVIAKTFMKIGSLLESLNEIIIGKINKPLILDRLGFEKVFLKVNEHNTKLIINKMRGESG